MRPSIVAKVFVSATLVFGLSGCGGLIKVQRAVEAKGYEVEKVGVQSSSAGRILTVYTEDQLDQAQKQDVIETATSVYHKEATVNVVKGDGSGVKTSTGSSGSKPNSSGGSRTNHK